MRLELWFIVVSVSEVKMNRALRLYKAEERNLPPHNEAWNRGLAHCHGGRRRTVFRVQDAAEIESFS